MHFKWVKNIIAPIDRLEYRDQTLSKDYSPKLNSF
jgi:hypothetical protein